MATIIIFNSPPNSGKDFACEHMVKKFGGQHLMFKEALYQEAAALASVGFSVFKELATNRDKKEKALDLLKGYSPRSWLIHVSENIVKPNKGNDYFGQKLKKQISEDVVFISDGGFVDELKPLCQDHSVFLFQLARDGCSFEGDSRRYITKEEAKALGCVIVEIHNCGTPKFLVNLQAEIAKCLAHIDGVNILNPKPSMFNIENIAKGLSKVCRYSGQIDKFYSVAEHCVILYNHCKQNGLSVEEQKYALLHDASEAYLQDVPRPLKHLLPEYRAIEDKFSKAIYERFGVEVSDRVSNFDQHIVADEVLVVKNKQPKWAKQYTPLGVSGKVKCLNPKEAEELFLNSYFEIFKEKK